MNYNNKLIETLLLDEQFLKWIVDPTSDLDEYWTNYIHQHPEDIPSLEKAKQVVQQLSFQKHSLSSTSKLKLLSSIEKSTTGKDLKIVVNSLNNYINEGRENQQSEGPTLALRQKHSKNSIRSFILKAAAVLLIILSVASIVYYTTSFNNSENQIVKTERIFFKQNPKGQKLTTFLPDGTKTILNSSSTVEYHENPIGNERIVKLKGEAFFEVTHDPSRPFKVISGDITTTALGTSFNVKLTKDGRVDVALLTGKVEVKYKEIDSVILEPGKIASSSGDNQLSEREFDYLEVMGWKDGKLVFNECDLQEIIKRLEDWYGVEINSEVDQNKRFKYTGVNDNETLDEVLKGISFVHHFNYEINGNNVRLY